MTHQPNGAVPLGLGIAGWLCYAFAFTLALLTFPSLATGALLLAWKATVPGALIIALLAVPAVLGYDAYRFGQHY